MKKMKIDLDRFEINLNFNLIFFSLNLFLFLRGLKSIKVDLNRFFFIRDLSVLNFYCIYSLPIIFHFTSIAYCSIKKKRPKYR